ncbi:hypothetical protein GF406_16470 [candidate division KSB1 bacterium]|nr:hypothetical protein [candidate division KSB1 bacterium]
MDFNLVNQYAEEIKQSGDAEQHKRLISDCIPYLLYLRTKFGFLSIPKEDIKNELAYDAVSDAIMKESDKLPFIYRLKNTFRDICRKRIRITREHDSNLMIEKYDIRIPKLLMGTSAPQKSPPTQSQDNELVEMANNILADHDPFSKKVVLQKTRGSTYPEISDIFETPSNECKRVYWHDIDVIRTILNANPEEE